jgi:hypothetical protein
MSVVIVAVSGGPDADTDALYRDVIILTVGSPLLQPFILTPADTHIQRQLVRPTMQEQKKRQASDDAQAAGAGEGRRESCTSFDISIVHGHKQVTNGCNCSSQAPGNSMGC